MVQGRRDQWAKLCFERSPSGTPTIVSVVNKGVSDDANSVPIEGNRVFLRVAGLSSQSPTGESCRSTFSEIRYEKKTLENLRNGE